jgi:hypothetical protein
MRESEREQLARRDAYERELESRAKKRKQDEACSGKEPASSAN